MSDIGFQKSATAYSHRAVKSFNRKGFSGSSLRGIEDLTTQLSNVTYRTEIAAEYGLITAETKTKYDLASTATNKQKGFGGRIVEAAKRYCNPLYNYNIGGVTREIQTDLARSVLDINDGKTVEDAIKDATYGETKKILIHYKLTDGAAGISGGISAGGIPTSLNYAELRDRTFTTYDKVFNQRRQAFAQDIAIYGKALAVGGLLATGAGAGLVLGGVAGAYLSRGVVGTAIASLTGHGTGGKIASAVALAGVAGLTLVAGAYAIKGICEYTANYSKRKERRLDDLINNTVGSPTTTNQNKMRRWRKTHTVAKWSAGIISYLMPLVAFADAPTFGFDGTSELTPPLVSPTPQSQETPAQGPVPEPSSSTVPLDTGLPTPQSQETPAQVLQASQTEYADWDIKRTYDDHGRVTNPMNYDNIKSSYTGGVEHENAISFDYATKTGHVNLGATDCDKHHLNTDAHGIHVDGQHNLKVFFEGYQRADFDHDGDLETKLVTARTVTIDAYGNYTLPSDIDLSTFSGYQVWFADVNHEDAASKTLCVEALASYNVDADGKGPLGYLVEKEEACHTGSGCHRVIPAQQHEAQETSAQGSVTPPVELPIQLPEAGHYEPGQFRFNLEGIINHPNFGSEATWTLGRGDSMAYTFDTVGDYFAIQTGPGAVNTGDNFLLPYTFNTFRLDGVNTLEGTRDWSVFGDFYYPAEIPRSVPMMPPTLGDWGVNPFSLPGVNGVDGLVVPAPADEPASTTPATPVESAPATEPTPPAPASPAVEQATQNEIYSFNKEAMLAYLRSLQLDYKTA